MRPHARTSRLVPLLVACSLLTTGCYSHVPIRPSELPKLNGDFATAQAVGVNTTLHTFSVAQVQGEDGRMVELKGEHDVIITLKNGTTTKYGHPVSVSEEGGAFVIRSANQAEVRVPLDDIQRVEVTNYNGIATTFIAVGVGVVASLVVFAVVF